MAGKPTGPPSSERSSGRAGEDRGAEKDGLQERYGLLVVARDVKDDGRAMIIYTRAQGESQ